jgi:hypothetical protein
LYNSTDLHYTFQLLFFLNYLQPIFLNEITAEENASENENEFVIGLENNRTSWMYLLAPGVTEKRLWVKNIREAKKRYIQTEQQYLQRQKSSKTIYFHSTLETSIVSYGRIKSDSLN